MLIALFHRSPYSTWDYYSPEDVYYCTRLKAEYYNEYLSIEYGDLCNKAISISKLT